MDTRLLSARLYSGSLSPGKGPYRFTAPVAAGLRHDVRGRVQRRVQDETCARWVLHRRPDDRPLADRRGLLGDLRERRRQDRRLGQGCDDDPEVVSVRQNLVPLVADGRPTPRPASCTGGPGGRRAARPPRGQGSGHRTPVAFWPGHYRQRCPGLCNGSRSGPAPVGTVSGRAGAVRAMQLDINPNWPDFVTYDPRPGERADAATMAASSFRQPCKARRLSSNPPGPATSSRCRPAPPSPASVEHTADGPRARTCPRPSSSAATSTLTALESICWPGGYGRRPLSAIHGATAVAGRAAKQDGETGERRRDPHRDPPDGLRGGGQRRGRHARGHPAGDEPGPDQDHADPGTMQQVGEPARRCPGPPWPSRTPGWPCAAGRRRPRIAR